MIEPSLADRKALVSQIKLDEGCVDCGYRDSSVALDFDHVRGRKLGNISTMVADSTVPWEKIVREMAKCEVRCANCHRVITSVRKDEARFNRCPQLETL